MTEEMKKEYLFLKEKNTVKIPLPASRKEWVICPSCNWTIFACDNYCSKCGQKVKEVKKIDG